MTIQPHEPDEIRSIDYPFYDQRARELRSRAFLDALRAIVAVCSKPARKRARGTSAVRISHARSTGGVLG